MAGILKSSPSIIERRKTAKKDVRRLAYRRKAKADAAKAAARKRAAKAPKKASREVQKLAAAAAKRAWLSQPATMRTVGVRGVKALSIPTGKGASRINVGAMKRGGVRLAPLGGTFNGVEMVPVVSSNVASAGYSKENSELYVRFLSGDVYVYRDVDEGVYVRMMAAPSKGKFVWYELRDQYDYAKVA